MEPSFIGIALPPKVSFDGASMKPPPVTQQPPELGGWQSGPWSAGVRVVVGVGGGGGVGTQAPHGAGCVPGSHVGGPWHTTWSPSGVQFHGGPPGPPSLEGGPPEPPSLQGGPPEPPSPPDPPPLSPPQLPVLPGGPCPLPLPLP